MTLRAVSVLSSGAIIPNLGPSFTQSFEVRAKPAAHAAAAAIGWAPICIMIRAQ
jgi:hypothetical protein